MLMGGLPQGDHFGFGDDYGYGDDDYGYGDDDYGYGDDYGFGLMSSFDPSMNMGLPGYGYGAAPAIVRPRPGPRRPGPGRPGPRRPPMHPAIASTAARTLLLDPNRHSTVKVERYSFSFSPAANLVLGTASAIPTFTQNPSTSIKGQRIIMNAPLPGFVLIASLQVANVNVFVGGVEDAFNYSPLAVGVMLDLPRLDPQNRATAAGAYTGVLPPGYTAGNAFQFVITLQGPATLAGGYGQ